MTVTLTEQERQICNLLEDVVKHIHEQDVSKPRLVLRIAGGWVRDKLLGRESHDIDIAIDHMSGYDLARHVNTYLEAHDYPVHSIAKINQNPERSKHLETATTTVLGLAVDFVNLRSETYNSDSRIPQMEFGTPTDDALRRDITINALFYNIHTRMVEDFTGKGLSDLRAGIVRTPLDPFTTFTDDPLRVLRVLRFASRFAFAIDPITADAIRRSEIRHDLDAKISRERVGVELDKMAAGPHPLLAIQMVLGYGLYSTVFRAPPVTQWISHLDAMESEALAVELTRNVLELLDSEADAGHDHGVVKPIVSLLLPSALGAAATDQQARRALVLAACLFPYHAVSVRDKKRTVPAALVVVRDSIKLSMHDATTTVALHESTTKIAAVAQQCLDSTIDRVTLGQQIRDTGAQWATSVLFAAAVDMLVNKVSLDHASCKYRAYVAKVIEYGLAEAYSYKHIVDGKSAARILGIKPGPAIKKVLDMVMVWQLHNPDGSQQECEAFIADVISKEIEK
ncbi:CCA tRNA nucleotidyltransferase, mitochondrial [Coemansia sp. RSA 1813]|nr:CCA tRNA nucleotidyltransferase, mitochondrial [Coemansia sp. RSA 1646]KAJ1770178.1 CCA tRNA nucleotidyltransferase, mitochondrial [Coemansia sp. RSA 1843]KAJ2089996.1 CCA tRNA nucleotidyltransferase, mitochondrial [Coemansia sp. RSA 986]KAJ2217043.1 CCA tRNA nucleotidyltransferase, mitochondrial [Coemansia sp. RSA 487]KAJ2566559.1 CCA tRNA nucleotidyltransferase, mitochondrial [Coemansia sp. RSA 1813]